VAARLRGITHVINVQGDEPLIDPALISRLAAALAKDKRVEMITAAVEFGPDEDVVNPNAVKVVLDRDSDALYFSRSLIPHLRDPGARFPHLRHLGIYGFSTKFLLQFVKWKPGRLEQAEQLEQLRALENGTRIRVLLTKSASIGVDTPADARIAEARISTLNTPLSKSP
jgi:3-deoxy-manno-octulosonate cytidylyltransferase (CMP-KDO synthetase)